MQIGTFVADVPVVLAPMAGVTDAAFRRICREMGAGLTVGEMVASEERLRDTRKSAGRWRVDPDDPFPVIQILGADPSEMADAAQYAEAAGLRQGLRIGPYAVSGNSNRHCPRGGAGS